MQAPITESELDLLRRIASVQEEDVVSFCIELDLVPDEPFVVDDVVDPVVDALGERARSGGLPVSKYDAEDLLQFDTQQLAAFGAAMGLRLKPGLGKPDLIADIVHRLRRVGKKLPRTSQIPFFLTYFLPTLVRVLSQS
jgi:hypothetical protein